VKAYGNKNIKKEEEEGGGGEGDGKAGCWEAVSQPLGRIYFRNHNGLFFCAVTAANRITHIKLN
jgi:hypothetical protein